jgi:hypothetical protein
MIGMRASDNLTGHRLSVRRTVLDHLRHRGIIGVDDRRVTDGSPLALGVAGVTVDAGGVVAIDGDRCVPAHRTLSDLLGTDGYLADRAAVAARQDYDPVLYYAIRDFLPPREKASKRCAPAGTPEHAAAESHSHLFADLVVYQPGTLPGDEPFRSTGHWNLPGQLEIFQTLTGRVLMLVGGRTRDGRPFLYEQVCEPGSLMAVPFGIWHVTYVLDGPAVVFNLTTEVGSSGQGPAHPGEEKYRRAAPIAVTARRSGGWVGDDLRSWGRPLGAPRTDWLQSLLAPGESLADLHLYASPSRLAALQRLASEAYGQCWPHHGGFQAP